MSVDLTGVPVQPSQLYEAAVGYLVSDKSESNAWEQVVKHSTAYHQRLKDGADVDVLVDELRKEFQVVEQQVKSDYQLDGRMPAAWRSAKSTVLGALRNNIPLVREDGSISRKTDVGKLIRAVKNGSIKLSDLDRVRDLLLQADVIFCRLSTADRTIAASVANTLSHSWGAALPVAVPSAKAA